MKEMLPQVEYSINESELLASLSDDEEVQDTMYFQDWDSREEETVLNSHNLHGIRLA